MGWSGGGERGLRLGTLRKFVDSVIWFVGGLRVLLLLESVEQGRRNAGRLPEIGLSRWSRAITRGLSRARDKLL